MARWCTAIIRDSGPIDVHVIGQDTSSSGERLAAPPSPGLTWNRRVAGTRWPGPSA